MGNPGAIPGIPAVGDPVTGTLTYDITAADTQPGDPTMAQYQQTGAGTGLFVQSGGWSFVPGTTTIIVENDAGATPADAFVILSSDETNLGLAQSTPSYIQLTLRDLTAKALSSDKLPATFEFTQWTQDPWGALDFKTNSDPSYEVEAILDSLTPTSSRSR